MYNTRYGVILFPVSTSIKVVLEHFSLALTVKLYDLEKFYDLENIGQYHNVHHSNLCHWYANINLFKSSAWAFFASSRDFSDIKYNDFQTFCDLENIGRIHDIQHSKWRHSMANINSKKVEIVHFSLALTVFQILNIIWFPETLRLWKYRSRSLCEAIAMAIFDG